MDRVRFSKTHFVILFFGLFFFAGFFTYLVPLPGAIHFLDSMPIVCPLRRVTGVLCSFCGMTHSWLYFWHGEWTLALSENALSIPLFIASPFLAGSMLIEGFWIENRMRRAGFVAIAILAFYTIARNIHL